MNILWVPSPNFTPGRGGKKVDRFVIHWVDGTLSSADAQFSKDGSKAPYSGTSAHFGVEDGTVHQYVKVENTAWHAHNFDVNQRSIGIEHSADPFRPASDDTYSTSGQLIASICHQLGLTPSRGLLHKHSEYYNTQCSGTIDLDRLAYEAIKAFSAADVAVSAPGIEAVQVSYIVPIHQEIKVIVPVLRVRTAPSVNAPEVVAKRLVQGNTLFIKEAVLGDDPYGDGRNKWLHTEVSGLYIWAGGTNYNS